MSTWLEQELKNNARDVYLEFRKDIEDGLANAVISTDLQKRHVKVLFDKYVQDSQYLFDRGEMYAVALARAMGIRGFAFGPIQKSLDLMTPSLEG